MANPKAYEPQEGYMYQLLVKTPYERAYEHCDYAIDREDKNHLLEDYRTAYGTGFSFKTIRLPQKYWKRS